MSKSQIRSQKRVRFAASDKFRSTLNRRVNQYFENNQPESVDSSNDELSDSQNVNEEQNDDKKEVLEASNEKNNEDQSLTTQNNENNKEENAEQQGLDIPDEKKDDSKE